MNWWEIVKTEQALGSKQLVTTNIKRVPKPTPKDGPCNRKLKQVSDYLKNITNQIETQLEQVVKDINKNNPPVYGDDFRYRDLRGTITELHFTVTRDEDAIFAGGPHSVQFKIGARGAWPYKIWVNYHYTPVPEENACHLIEMFNDERSTDLNGYSDHEMNDKTGGQTRGWLPSTYRYRGTSTGYSSWKTSLDYNDRRLAPHWKSEISLIIDSGIGYPHSTEIYPKIREHIKQIQEAVNLDGIHKEVENILR